MKEQLKKIRADLDVALAEVLKKHGLRELRSGPCTFTPEGSFVFKVEGVAAGGASKDEQLYDILASGDPIWPKRNTPEAKVMVGGRLVDLFGANTTLSKVKYRDDDGKAWLTSTEQMRVWLNARRAIGSIGPNTRVPPPKRGAA
jgi:hypothetical protein